MDCEEVDLNGQLVIPPYVDPHLHLDYIFTASLGEENGSGTLFEGIQRWSESKGNMTVEQMKERIYSGIRKEMLHGVQGFFLASSTPLAIAEVTSEALPRP